MLSLTPQETFFKEDAMSRLTQQIASPLIIALFILSVASLAASYPSRAYADSQDVHAWLTTPDQGNLLKEQPAISFSNHADPNTPTITVNTDQKYQSMTGFGASLTASSAVVLSQSNIDQ